MASNVNTAVISGNLTRNAELRMTQSGTPVLSFGVACNRSVKNQQTGEWEDRPDYIDCVMFGNRAQGIAQYMTKGTFVVVHGRLAYSSWQDKETGKNRSKIEVAASEVNFHSNQQQGYQQPMQQPQQAYQQPTYPQQPAYPQQGYQQPAQAYQQPVQQPQAMPAQPAPVVQQPAPQMPQHPMHQPPAADMYDEDIPF